MEYVTSGVEALKAWAGRNRVKSVAIPALGSGLGGLAWNDVKIELERLILMDHGSPECDFFVFHPH
jgi:O-acetyl-ADP-ribose deacetylase (regulator of RNase III)